MKLTIRLFLLLPLISLVASSCSMDLQRKPVEFARESGPPLRCYEPPPDVIVKGGNAYANLSVLRVGDILRGTGGVGLDVERIRQELPPEAASFELFHFRMCVEHGNGTLSKQEYQAYLSQIFPAYKNNPPTVLVRSSQLVETCGPSFKTKRPAHLFVPHWASKIETLRLQRNTHSYDLENLFQVYGRGLVSMAGVNPHEELDFTLDCLERIGYLKVQKYEPPRTLPGTVVENRKIVFSDPTKPVPN